MYSSLMITCISMVIFNCISVNILHISLYCVALRLKFKMQTKMVYFNTFWFWYEGTFAIRTN